MYRIRILALVLALGWIPFSFSAVAQDKPSVAQLQALEGEYTPAGRPEAALSFYEKDGQLVFESLRVPPTELNAATATLFEILFEKTSFRFTLDAVGKAHSVSITGGSKETVPRSGPPVHHLFHQYQRSEAMIPMRDGVKLHTVILKPVDITAPLPFLIQRTPYGTRATSNDWFFLSRPNLAREGYIYVGQDIRGRNGSEGEFVMCRPTADHSDAKAIDETTDAWDTVDWLLKNVAGNNGRAGFVGTSYPGFLAMAAGLEPHPAVKAISPQAPMIDTWMGDDFFHNGAFRQGYGYDYVLGMESGGQEVDYGYEKSGAERDGFAFFLENGNFAGDVKRSGLPVLPSWKLFLEHPSYDEVWRSRGVENLLWAVDESLPVLSVGGYYDQEDLYGPQEVYRGLEPKDSAHNKFLILGPWQHGAWAQPARTTGQIQWGSATGEEFRKVENAFFAHYLKDASKFDLEDTLSFQTGTNQWKRYGHFPPAEAKPTRLYLSDHGQLSWDRPQKESTTTYISDPANPVPYRQQPIQPTYGKDSKWGPWMTEDQRFVAGRKDVASWKLPVQIRPLTITGEVEAEIFASTTGTDGDLIVKLIDQYPDDDPDPAMRGYQLMVNGEIIRGRYLAHSFSTANPLQPGKIWQCRFSLHAADHVFLPGHRVVVQVQSSWFPLYDRNPQTFVPNIMTAKPSDYKVTKMTIFSVDQQESSLILPVVER